MSTWRKKAIECLPECQGEFEDPSASIYGVFIELLPATVAAHRVNDLVKLNKYYGFAEWCFEQKAKDQWNAAGVSFYEHLSDYEETLKDISSWVKPEIYRQLRPLLERRLDREKLKSIDRQFDLTKK
jgi:oligoendopeptidase F